MKFWLPDAFSLQLKPSVLNYWLYHWNSAKEYAFFFLIQTLIFKIVNFWSSTKILQFELQYDSPLSGCPSKFFLEEK